MNETIQSAPKVALIPAYQPGDSLLPLVWQLTWEKFEVVLVDDGSGSDYEDIFRRAALWAAVLTHPKNRGKGAALKTGLSYIAKHYPDTCTVVTLDADGQHAVEDVLSVVREAEQHPESLTLGIRSFGAGTPRRSLMGNRITSAVFRLVSGRRLGDTQTGLRAFSGQQIPFLLSIQGDRYEYEMNVLIEAARDDIPFQEVPIRTIYLDGNSASHFRTLRDSVRVFGGIFRFAISSFLSFLIDYGLFTLLTLVTGGLGAAVSVPLSNVLARIGSATANYTINRNIVFRNRESVAKTAPQYFALAAGILCANTALLSFLTTGLGANAYLAKILVEILFFFVSWTVQRFWIFRSRRTGAKRGRSGVFSSARGEEAA